MMRRRKIPHGGSNLNLVLNMARNICCPSNTELALSISQQGKTHFPFSVDIRTERTVSGELEMLNCQGGKNHKLETKQGEHGRHEGNGVHRDTSWEVPEIGVRTLQEVELCQRNLCMKFILT